MAKVKISSLTKKSTVKIKIGGYDYDFVVIYQGKPPTGNYDDSCDGTWLMLKDCFTLFPFGSSQIFTNADIYDSLNIDFYNSLENGARGVIKPVKIPCSTGVNTVENVDAKVFLLSALEAGYTDGNFNAEGANLEFFANNEERKAIYNGATQAWGLRTLDKTNTNNVIAVGADGAQTSVDINTNTGFRPVFIVYSSCYVDDDGHIIPDISPVITSSSGVSGTNLGRKNAAFAFTYTVTTTRPDLTLAVEEILSGEDVNKTREVVASPVSGQQRTFAVVVDNADDFYKLMNGEKTLTVRAYYSDFNDASVNSETEFYVTFEKYINEATITMKQPLEVEGAITKAILTLEGNIPNDAIIEIKATNNAKDTSPVWQDVTSYVQTNSEFNFTNTSAVNGPAFNFTIHVKRGASDETGYIAGIVGAFE